MAISALLFVIGVIGVVVRRNAIVVVMSIEIMLNAGNLTFVTYAHFLNSMDGQLIVFFVMGVAAAEAAVGLAILILIYRNRESTDVDELNLLKL